MPIATYLCIAKALALNHGEEDEDDHGEDRPDGARNRGGRWARTEESVQWRASFHGKYCAWRWLEADWAYACTN